MDQDIVIPIAGMIFILCIIFGSFGFVVLNKYFKRGQSVSVEELMDINDHLDELEERMRVVEASMTDRKV